MRLESIKSIILVILVIISLTLTERVWNFSSDYLQYEGQPISRETSIHGEKLSAKEIIRPSHMIFHKQGEHFSLFSKEDEVNLYKQMQNWSITQFGALNSFEQEFKENELSVELTFPVELPLTMLPQFFKIGESEILPDITFDRIYFEPDTESQSSIKITFVSSENKQIISANSYVQEINPYKNLMNYVQNDEALRPLTEFYVTDQKVLYLPEDSFELPKRIYQTNEISDWPLINSLFQEPTAVKSIGYYTDGSKKLETSYIYSNKKYMNFLNPISPNNKRLDRTELITKSIAFVNNHDGWTDQFVLIDIHERDASSKFQLLVEGYPIMDNLGKMELVWQNQELTAYNRPLVELSNSFDLDDYDNQTTTVSSGDEVIAHLNSKQFQYNVQLIEDIRIGYKIINEENEDIISLEPQWFVNVNGIWRSITLDDAPEQGGV